MPNPIPGPFYPPSQEKPRGDDAFVPGAPANVATSDLPEVIVEWLPGQSPFATDGNWVRIDSQSGTQIISGSTQRGRQYELDQFQAGTLTLQLESLDRVFDPEYTAGPYYGQLLPMAQIRLVFKWNATRYPVWRGYVYSWGQTVLRDKVFQTTVSCRDGFYRLQQITLPSSAWALQVLKDNPSCWFRLGENGTARVTDSSSNGNYGVYDNCQQGQTGLVVNDSDQAVSFAHSLEERVTIQNPNLITGYPFTVSMLFKIDNSDPAGLKVMFNGPVVPTKAVTVGGGVQLVMNFGPPNNGVIDGAVYDTSGNFRSAFFSLNHWDDNKPHLLHWVVNSATSQLAYMDGVAVTATSVGGTGAPAWPGPFPSGYTIGDVSDQGGPDFGFGTNDVNNATPKTVKQRGTIDEFTVYSAPLTADRISAQYLAAFGWANDTTGQRVNRFLDALNWSPTLRDIQTGISVLGPANWSLGATALSVMQSWADTETGLFFMSREGNVVWRSRHSPLIDLRSTRSRCSFGDNSSGANVVIQDDALVTDRDPILLRNPVTASRNNGVTVTVEDTSLTNNTTGSYGPRGYTAPVTEDAADEAVRDRANWILARFKNEHTRIVSMSPIIRQQPTQWDRVLDLELGDRITLIRTPLGTGNTIQIDQILESISWQFDPFTCTPTFVGAAVDPNVGNYLIWDEATSLWDTALWAY